MVELAVPEPIEYAWVWSFEAPEIGEVDDQDADADEPAGAVST
jgi:hypothetical protein